jgi:hypothetical protein
MIGSCLKSNHRSNILRQQLDKRKSLTFDSTLASAVMGQKGLTGNSPAFEPEVSVWGLGGFRTNPAQIPKHS